MSSHPASRRTPVPRRSRWAVILAALGLLLLPAGCAAPDASTPGFDGPATQSQPAPEAEAAGADGADASAERQVARTASVSVASADAEGAAQRVRDIAAAHDGWLTHEYLSARQDGSRPSEARLTVSVPSEQLDATLDDLAGVGTLLSRSVQASDVTDAVVDTDARIRSLEASIERISALMERAGSVTEIATVEKELASRQSDLEALRAQRQYYASITERATVDVSVQSPATASSNPFASGLLAGWDALGSSFRALLVLAGALLPFAVVGAVIAVPVVWLVRRRRPTPPSSSKASPSAASPDGEQAPASSDAKRDAQP